MLTQGECSIGTLPESESRERAAFRYAVKPSDGSSHVCSKHPPPLCRRAGWRRHPSLWSVLGCTGRCRRRKARHPVRRQRALASSVPALLDAVKLAVGEVNANGGILKGQKLQMIVADTQGTAQGSVDAATKLVKVDNVAAIVGGLTSVTLMAAAHGVTIPSGVLLISPASTATIVTTLEDKDFVFRTIPSDAYQGWMLGNLVYDQGFRAVALTYINTDYGRGLADTFRDASRISVALSPVRRRMSPIRPAIIRS